MHLPKLPGSGPRFSCSLLCKYLLTWRIQWWLIVRRVHSFFLEGTAAAYAFTSIEGDLPASIAIMWSLFAIFAQQDDPFVHWTALVFAILSALCVLKGIWGLYRRFTVRVVLLEDEERGPLLGGR